MQMMGRLTAALPDDNRRSVPAEDYIDPTSAIPLDGKERHCERSAYCLIPSCDAALGRLRPGGMATIFAAHLSLVLVILPFNLTRVRSPAQDQRP